ncbi:KPN_02809 family neutral zinc metallopeptidase [Aquabacterium humicola]|uniref:KPN_02809 family neutral zinc metallopeptidase n=1 Tax=Aquabacterium humicola TaxID=3237377 RepID=UPI002543B7EE|nr:neutral zinc metallopeptidase [Rubrivivax pictus]
MRLDGHRESSNVEDARGLGGGGGRRFIGGRGIGIGTVAVALVAGWIFGINPLTILGALSGGGMPVAEQQAPAGAPPADDPKARFVSMILADTEDVWRAQFQAMGQTYREPKLRLYSGSEVTACGGGEAAMGPFYCPADQKVYIDLSFYEDMRSKLGAPGDFAQAYVIAHEVGHHVQNLLGTSERVQQARARSDQRTGNQLSVALELQADCYAGVWAHHAQRARQVLEQGDIEEGLNAASKIGDDALQKAAGRRVVPESFTHGSSAQRVAWFKRGLQGGSMQQCETLR